MPHGTGGQMDRRRATFNAPLLMTRKHNNKPGKIVFKTTFLQLYVLSAVSSYSNGVFYLCVKELKRWTNVSVIEHRVPLLTAVSLLGTVNR